MKHQGKALLAAGLVSLTTACSFDDPAGGLRTGPTRIQLTSTAVSVQNGDSVAVQAFLKDDQGNQLPVDDAAWTTSDPAIVIANLDTVRTAPGGTFSRAFLVGTTNQAGVATVTVTAQGVTNTVRVTVLPSSFPGVRAVTGPVTADTVVIGRPAPQAPLVVPYTAGDTAVFTATATVTFNATSAGVNFGPFPGYIVSRSATTLKAVSRTPFSGRATLTNLVYSGNVDTGPIAIATMQTDSFNLTHGRLSNASVVVSASAFGPGTSMRVTPPTGKLFSATTSAVMLGASAATILDRTVDSITVIATANYTGSVMVTNVVGGTTTYDSLRTGGAAIAIAASAFPGTVTNAAGNLLDVITINGGAATFTTVAATASQVTVNGTAAFILSRSATTITAIAKLAGSATVSISNVIVSGTTIPSLATLAPLVVSTTTGEANEPGNDVSGSATAVAGLAVLTDSAVIYGATDGASDAADYYSFTMPVAGAVAVRLDFFGNGSGSSDLNPDFDVVVCTTLSGTGACGYGQDLIPGNAASNVLNPEQGTSAAIAAGATVYVRLYPYFATAGGLGSYRLRIRIQ